MRYYLGNGGLAGLSNDLKVLRNLKNLEYKDRSTEVIKYLSLKSNMVKSFSIIGVGGISSANDAKV